MEATPGPHGGIPMEAPGQQLTQSRSRETLIKEFSEIRIAIFTAKALAQGLVGSAEFCSREVTMLNNMIRAGDDSEAEKWLEHVKGMWHGLVRQVDIVRKALQSADGAMS